MLNQFIKGEGYSLDRSSWEFIKAMIPEQSVCALPIVYKKCGGIFRDLLESS